jgi:hypothetical protein
MSSILGEVEVLGARFVETCSHNLFFMQFLAFVMQETTEGLKTSVVWKFRKPPILVVPS